MNDDKLKSLFGIYEAREPGRAYVEPFNDANGKQKGWKASTKWGRVKYFGSDFKKSAEKHAGIDSSDNVNDRGMDEEVANAEKITTDPNKPTSRFWGSNSLTNIYKKDTPGQSPSLNESYELAFDYQGKPSIAPTAGNLMMQAKGAFAHHNDVQNVMDVRAIKESIEKTFQNTVLEEDAEQLEAKCEILQDMVEHALATIEEIKATNVERDAWSTAEIMKLERYIESVNAYVVNILEDGDIVADAVGVVVPSYSYTDPRTGKYVTRKGRTIKRKSRRKIGNDKDSSNDEPKGPVSV